MFTETDLEGAVENVVLFDVVGGRTTGRVDSLLRERVVVDVRSTVAFAG